MTLILDGKALAQRLNQQLRARIAGLPRPPGLAVVLVGEDPASQVYVRRKGEVASKLGIRHWQFDRPADTSEQHVLALLDQLSGDPDVDGILVQLPVPRHIDPARVVDRIAAGKDVDGLTAVSSGLLSQGRPHLVPCTPLGVMRLLAESGVALSGTEACVIGRSNLVGRPMAQLLEQANCTVTLCHSRTRELEAAVRRAEVIVAAVGRPDTVRGDWIRPDAVVIDVGMNRLADGRLVGDVEYAVAVERARAITPVPGGVGPMTIAMLMENTVTAASRRQATNSTTR
jgi:methylenetetrahydrofolate dehydrogenase (NADP+)/methenyltetrahydrofolate cyclohydrolase